MSNSKKNRIELLIEYLTEYINARVEILRLDTIELGTNIVSGLLKFLIIGTLIVVAFLFLGFALAFFLGHLLNHDFAGFLIVGSIFLLATLWTSSRWNAVIKPRIMKSIIEMIPDDEADK